MVKSATCHHLTPTAHHLTAAVALSPLLTHPATSTRRAQYVKRHRYAPRRCGSGHHQSIMIARIARYTEILIITGDLPVGKRPLRWCRPHQRHRQQSEKKRRKMRYRMDGTTPEVQTNSTSRIFVAQVARLNRICRIEPIINNEILLLFFSPLNVTFANS